ncbi:MAG: hypothetical protein QM757_16195 [Paludibaculum sp.]
MKIDRQLASDLGVRVSDVASAVRLLMSGEDEISTYKEGSEQYLVTIRLHAGPARRSGCAQPPAGAFRASMGLIRLDSIAKLERGLGPSRIDRFSPPVFGSGSTAMSAPGHVAG